MLMLAFSFIVHLGWTGYIKVHLLTTSQRKSAALLKKYIAHGLLDPNKKLKYLSFKLDGRYNSKVERSRDQDHCEGKSCLREN